MNKWEEADRLGTHVPLVVGPSWAKLGSLEQRPRPNVNIQIFTHMHSWKLDKISH